MRWLKSWFGAGPPPTPVLLRVLDAAGRPPPVLDIETRWAPSGRRAERTVRTAEGLCVVHWVGDEDEVELRIRGVDAEARLSVQRARRDGGRVREVRLTPAPAPAELSPRLSASSFL